MQKSLRTLTALAACVFTVLTPALAAAAPAATQGSSVLDPKSARAWQRWQ